MQRIKKVNLVHAAGLLLLYISGPLFLAVTNPQQLALPLVLVPFVWLFAVMFLSTTWVLRRKATDLPPRRRAVIAGVFGALPVLLLVFQSIHQLTIKDVLLVVALIGAVSFYFLRADFLK